MVIVLSVSLHGMAIVLSVSLHGMVIVLSVSLHGMMCLSVCGWVGGACVHLCAFDSFILFGLGRVGGIKEVGWAVVVTVGVCGRGRWYED